MSTLADCRLPLMSWNRLHMTLLNGTLQALQYINMQGQIHSFLRGWTMASTEHEPIMGVQGRSSQRSSQQIPWWGGITDKFGDALYYVYQKTGPKDNSLQNVLSLSSVHLCGTLSADLHLTTDTAVLKCKLESRMRLIPIIFDPIPRDRQRYFNVSPLHELFDTVNAQNILGFIRDIGLYRLL